MPEKERIFLVLAMHFLNDLNTLQKCVYFSSRCVTDGVQRSAENAQALFFTRVLAGKLWEGWQLLRRNFFGSGLSKQYENQLSKEAKDNLAGIKRYFSSDNATDLIRNEYEFHCPSGDKIKELLEIVPDNEIFEIYASDHHGNCRWLMSDVIINFSILSKIDSRVFGIDGLDPERAEETMVKLHKEIHNITRRFLDVLGDCITVLMTKDGSLFDTEDVILDHVLDMEQIRIPYFMKPPPSQ